MITNTLPAFSPLPYNTLINSWSQTHSPHSRPYLIKNTHLFLGSRNGFRPQRELSVRQVQPRYFLLQSHSIGDGCSQQQANTTLANAVMVGGSHIIALCPRVCLNPRRADHMSPTPAKGNEGTRGTVLWHIVDYHRWYIREMKQKLWNHRH